jgi:large subunit ribosomal protein L11
MEKGMPIPVVITAYSDRTFTFITKKPPNSFWIKKLLKLKSGAKTPGTEIVAEVTMDQLRELAKEKIIDMNANDIEGAAKMLAGSARSMGVQVME